MQPSHQQIASAFSQGRFTECYPYFSEDIHWQVVGQSDLVGKAAVVQFCEKTAAYFNTVTTQFTIHQIIANANGVAINGHALFVNANNQETSVASCDVYAFEAELLKTITSYCITLDS